MTEKEREELKEWATERLKQTKTLERALEDIRIELARLRNIIEQEN